jgi:ABC-type Zn2+ transport system substrate-binding protein/surface adhesin
MHRSVLRILVLPLLVLSVLGTACGHGKKKKQDDKHEHKPGDGHDHDHKPGDGHDHGSTGTK